MRKLGPLAVILIFLLALGQGPNRAPAAIHSPLLARPAGAAVGQLIKEKKNSDEVKTKSVKGTLQGVDNNKVIVTGQGQQPITLKLSGETKITVDGKEATLTDLKKGQQASCVYVDREGVNVCLSVSVQADKK
jgi:hypothetical protein